ncbi:ExbD/TolR family protein [Undibacterium sp. Di27W]|uniref:ExbD/TolR family protein n=1 Tax=Undibacterium sp. Di27W TaxID=3413036 RepID=UPI003BEFC8BB
MPNQHKTEPELMMNLDNTPMIGLLLALIMMLLMSLPPERHLIDYGSNDSCGWLRPETTTITLSVDLHGGLQWNGNTVTMDQLGRNFQALARQQSSTYAVYLHAGNATTYRHVARVLALAQQQGVNRIGLISRAGEFM